MKEQTAKEVKKLDWGKNMIKVTVRFWTDHLPSGTTKQFDWKKTAWEFGKIELNANDQRDIKGDEIMFNALEEFMPKFAELFKRNNINLVKNVQAIDTIDLDKIKEGSNKVR